MAEPCPLVVTHHHELVEEPAIVSGLAARQERIVPLVRALPALPRPVALSLFLVAVVVGERAQRLEMLRALEGQPPERILAIEAAPADAEIGGTEAPRGNLQAIAVNVQR